MSYLQTLLRIDSIEKLWKTGIGLGIVTFVTILTHDFIIPMKMVPLINILLMGGCLGTLFLFGLGDAGILEISAILRNEKLPKSISHEARKYLLADLFFVVTHIGILDLLVWCTFVSEKSFMICILVLMGVNFCWLAAKQHQFMQAKDNLTKENPLWKQLQACCDSINKWVGLNGAFIVALGILFSSLEVCNIEACVAMVIVRSILDYVLCRHLYTFIYAGDFQKEKIPDDIPPPNSESS